MICAGGTGICTNSALNTHKVLLVQWKLIAFQFFFEKSHIEIQCLACTQKTIAGVPVQHKELSVLTIGPCLVLNKCKLREVGEKLEHKPTVQPIGQWQFPVTGWQFPWFWHCNTSMTMSMMTMMTMSMLVTIPTWQEEVQLAPWVPGGQGSSQRAPLHPARQLQPPDLGSQNPPGRICKLFKKWEKCDLQILQSERNVS